MVVVDVNVLVAAHMVDHPHHQASAAWLQRALTDATQTVVVPDLVWVGFVRIATNPRIFRSPTTIANAAAFVRGVEKKPSYRSVAGLRGGVAPLLDLCVAAQARGDLVTDAYISAIALQLGASVATFDRDFRRFDDLRLITPTP
ncbi:MAG: PIN domain-containing protein [Micrococcales bacterium]|nr:PIN domain-containing protein [Micrococcales bacterium]